MCRKLWQRRSKDANDAKDTKEANDVSILGTVGIFTEVAFPRHFIMLKCFPMFQLPVRAPENAFPNSSPTRRHGGLDDRIEDMIDAVQQGRGCSLDRMRDLLRRKLARDGDIDAAVQRLVRATCAYYADFTTRIIVLAEGIQGKMSVPPTTGVRPPTMPVGIAEVSQYSRHSALAEDD